MTTKELKEIIDKAQTIVNDVVENINSLNGDELSKIYVRLAGFYDCLCGHHEQIKSDYITMWSAIRPHYKSDKACNMYLLHTNESAKMYDNLKYTLKGRDKTLDAIKSRLIELTSQRKHQS